MNWGCFPTKSLIHDSQFFSEARSSEYLEGEIKLNLEKVMERKDRVIHNLVNGIETILINRGVMIIQGNGRFVDSKNLIVKRKDGSEVRTNADRIIISTGAILDSSPFRTDGEILGVHILAPQATELISIASLAMRNEMGIEELKAAVYAHPTLSEAFFEAVLDVKGEAIHFLKGGVEL